MDDVNDAPSRANLWGLNKRSHVEIGLVSNSAFFTFQHMAFESEEALPFVMELGVTRQRVGQDRKDSATTSNRSMLTP
eukprot:7620168-Karenia_brevis.AAC.1